MNKFIHRVLYENGVVKEEDVIIPAGLALAVGLEGDQYPLPYRAWNVNDAIGNGAGEPRL